MKSISVFEWNIHQQGGNGGGRIPPWVKDEINGNDIKNGVNGYDIAVLTEFCTKCEGRTAFIADMEELGYRCIASENPKGNDILIAVKSCFPILDHAWTHCYGKDLLPENLRVDIDCGGNGVLTVVGLRCKALRSKKENRMQREEENNINRMRWKEFRWGLNQVKDIQNPILITGDFNNNRRETKDLDWSISKIENMLQEEGFILYTPEGSSIFEERPCKYEFPYDHFAVRGANIELFPYDRDFTSRDPSAYFLGRDFRELWYERARVENLAKVSPSFPDHAILKGILSF